MKNRFLFRTWNKIDKVMYTGLPFSTAAGNDTFDIILKFPQVYEVMQYANVTCDKVDVYEGDYLSDGDTVWKVDYSETMSGLCATAVGGYIPNDCKYFSLWHLCNGHNAEKKVEIVGNQFEYTGPLSELLNTYRNMR